MGLCLLSENDLLMRKNNAIFWMKSFRGPWKMQFLIIEISSLVSPLRVFFQHVYRFANGMADCLAKQGVMG